MAVLLVAVWWGMAVSGGLDKSATFDEPVHLTAGYSYWLTGDFRLHPENGALPQRWAALPLLFGDYRFPSPDQPAWRGGDVWTLGNQFLHQLGNPLESMLLRGRAMIALAGAGLGLLVYAWSRSLFGPAGGTLSLLLYVFCPGFLAHGGLVTSDVMLTLTLTASVWCVWHMLGRITVRSVLGSSVVMGLLFVSKGSAVLIVPMALALAVIRAVQPAAPRWRAVAAATAVHVVVVAAVIWSFYGFRYSAFGPLQQDGDHFYRTWEVVLADSGAAGTMITFARERRLLPEAYLYGFAYTRHAAQERRAFLNGAYSMTGWWYFFPYALLVKTPLALFAILALAAAGAGAQARNEPGPWRTAPLWVLLAVYWAVALKANLNIGYRHILPTYPAMFILAGAAAHWMQARHRVAWGLLAACLAWFILESVSIRPHYLAYFNQAAGGPGRGYRHLVDSSLDWGQDLPGLRRWLDRRGAGGAPVYLAYFGTDSPEYYGIESQRLPVIFSPGRKEILPLAGGVYCISATMLQAVYLEPGGYWRPLYERRYRELLADLEPYFLALGDEDARSRLVREKGRDFWVQRIRLYDQLRFGRLASYLRRREPDDHVGYSILIYRLTDAQVREALEGPPAGELAD